MILLRPRIRSILPLDDRASLVIGVDKPSAATTGVLPGVTRTDVTTSGGWPGTGTLTAGAVYSNLNIKYRPVPPAGTDPIVYRNCYFMGEPVGSDPGGGAGLCQSTSDSHCPQWFYDCTFAPQNPHWNWNGIIGHHYRAYRCDVSGAVDGFGVYDNNAGHGALDVDVVLQQCYVHDLGNWSNPPDTSHADGSHPDCMQQQGGAGLHIQGCNFLGFAGPGFALNGYGTNHTNAVLMITNNVGEVTGNDIQYNWFDGGAASVNIAGVFTGDFGICKNNRFGRGQRNGDTWAIIRPAAMTCDFGTTTDRNVFDDTGLPITLRNG